MADSIESTKGKHTPGPWSVHGLEIIGCDGTRIARMVEGSRAEHLADPLLGARMHADLRLLVEAPAMLEALRQIARFDNHAITGPGRIQADAMADIARDILARIDGEG
jgi:hypothetical protein